MSGGFKFDLGSVVRDVVTGFAGVAIARSEYVNGCRRYGVQSQELHNGKEIEADWIDQGQLEQVAPVLEHFRPPTEAAESRPGFRRGGPQPPPQREGNPPT